jgi:hypothetical protein
VRLVAALLVLSGPFAAAPAQDLRDLPPRSPPPVEPSAVLDEEDPGLFEVRSAATLLRDGVYFLNARIDYRLSSEAREALDSGVPLRIRLDVEFLNKRRFWFDNEDASLRQLYQLSTTR